MIERSCFYLFLGTVVGGFVYGIILSKSVTNKESMNSEKDPERTTINGHNWTTNRNDTEQEIRVGNLRNVCQHLHDLGQIPIHLPRKSYQYLYVNDDYKFIFCMMPKIACTNWKRVFLSLSKEFSHRPHVINDANHINVHELYGKYGNTLNKYSESEIKYRLEKYKKMIYVREPFSRVLSAYKDKILNDDNHGFPALAQKVKRLKGLTKEGNVTFDEFIKYLTDADTFEESYNQHWAKYSILCQPCLVHYDFIGKYETMDEDIKLAFRYMGIVGVAKFPERHVYYKQPKSANNFKNYFDRVPEQYIKKLYEFYKSDYLLFSYDNPNVNVLT